MQPDFFHPGNSHALVALQLDSSGHYQILAELFPEIEGQTFNCLLPGLVCCAPSGRGKRSPAVRIAIILYAAYDLPRLKEVDLTDFRRGVE
jgi:hypothetical protein